MVVPSDSKAMTLVPSMRSVYEWSSAFLKNSYNEGLKFRMWRSFPKWSLYNLECVSMGFFGVYILNFSPFVKKSAKTLYFDSVKLFKWGSM